MSEAIWGVTSGLKTMADDTVRITIDINPKYFTEACNLFGKRGVEVALARLEQGLQSRCTLITQKVAL